MSKLKILCLDIETAPSIGAYFQLYREGNIVWNERDWYILSFSVKWLGQKKVHTYALPDFKRYKIDPEDDFELVAKIAEFIEETDAIVAHNGDQFDMKKIRTRMIVHGMKPLSKVKQIDTKKIAKSVFGFDSNKLDDIARQLGLGRKIEHEGISLWKKCLQGDKKAWKTMKDYNTQDTILQEKVYLELRPWMTNHPNQNIFTGHTHACPVCGENNTQKRGFSISRVGKRQRYQCQEVSCGAWSAGELIKMENKVVTR